MKRVLVTGGAGFLGSHLCGALVAFGYRVTCVDNLSTGQEGNLAKLLDHPNFSFVKADVVHENISGEFDEIYHLASPASPADYSRLALATIAANTIGTHRMLELARKTGAKLLFTSTSEVYGDPEVHPQPETYWGHVNSFGPRACYDESKRLGETYCYEYHTRYGVAVTVVRIFNTYSATLRNNDGRVISNFVTQALTGGDITVYGDGRQTRSFCYVDDTVRGLIAAMESPASNGQVFNIGNPEEHTILDVAEMVKELTGSPSRIVFKPLPKDDPQRRCPDITKARRILGWEPKISLETGLRWTIEAYRLKLAAQAEMISSRSSQ